MPAADDGGGGDVDDALRGRFWAKVDVRGPGDCWPWTAAVDDKGYGMFKVGGRMWRAHRAAWLVTSGDPRAAYVCHRCDNPICVNPAHLFLGDQGTNMADCRAKGRLAAQRGQGWWNHYWQGGVEYGRRVVNAAANPGDNPSCDGEMITQVDD